ncbi:MAG: IMP dehydrogenase [Bacilli bacterium]|nr:IMP dehydrogenase [Clostridia bacterium]MBR4618023.1 IMP dehydrogenase [Bacilli bacterium]
MTNIIEEVQLDYCDVMIKPKRSTLNSRSEPDIYRIYKMKHTERVLYGNGLIVANMATTGTFAMTEVFAKNLMFTCLHKHYSFEEIKEFLEKHKNEEIEFKMGNENCIAYFNDYVFVSTGIKDGDYEKICKVLDLGYCKNLCIDIANGYIPKLLDFVKKIREKYSNLIIMVGNVCTGDMVQDIILAGADIVKCGIGPGANCTTRKQTGCGRPQLSAVIECAEAAHAVDGMLCADGGITCVGDINKAYGAGADFVMVGSLVAGSDEADGEIIKKIYKTNEVEVISCNRNDEDLNPIDNDYDEYDINETEPKYEIKKYKLAYGMSSKYAQDKHWNGMAKYRASEGIVTLKPYSGPVQNTIDEYLGGLRSCMTYISARRLKDIPKCCTFYRANRILNNDGKGI